MEGIGGFSFGGNFEEETMGEVRRPYNAKQYNENWERIFGKKEEPKKKDTDGRQTSRPVVTE